MVRVILPPRSSTHWIILWKSFLNTLTHVCMSGSHWESVATIDGTSIECPTLDFLDLCYRDDLIARSYFGQQTIFRPAKFFQQLIKARFFSVIESDVLFHHTARAKAKSSGTFFRTSSTDLTWRSTLIGLNIGLRTANARGERREMPLVGASFNLQAVAFSVTSITDIRNFALIVVRDLDEISQARRKFLPSMF